MQTENDYDKEVYNGDIGRVTDIDLDEGDVLVDFPPIGLKPPTSVGKEFNRAPQALKNTEPFDFSRRRFSLMAARSPMHLVN